jgi:hypothetical protein
MTVAIIIATVIAVPVILFPAAFVWYCNIGGLVAAMQKRKATVTATETA